MSAVDNIKKIFNVNSVKYVDLNDSYIYFMGAILDDVMYLNINVDMTFSGFKKIAQGDSILVVTEYVCN